MSYVENNLMPGETIVCQAKIHWVIFLNGITLGAIGLLVLVGDERRDGSEVAGYVLLFFSFTSLLKAFITKISTELVVTSKRVIAKIGLIRRNTIELNHSKVESFNVDQSIIGRILGYGTFIVFGTGGGKNVIQNIDSPLDFRRNAIKIIDNIQKS
jgi:uncharacterized membrane protein YdbT with pleckstrin-like domain